MNTIEAIDSRLAEIDDERMRLEATRSCLIAEEQNSSQDWEIAAEE